MDNGTLHFLVTMFLTLTGFIVGAKLEANNWAGNANQVYRKYYKGRLYKVAYDEDEKVLSNDKDTN